MPSCSVSPWVKSFNARAGQLDERLPLLGLGLDELPELWNVFKGEMSRAAAMFQAGQGDLATAETLLRQAVTLKGAGAPVRLNLALVLGLSLKPNLRKWQLAWAHTLMPNLMSQEKSLTAAPAHAQNVRSAGLRCRC